MTVDHSYFHLRYRRRCNHTMTGKAILRGALIYDGFPPKLLKTVMDDDYDQMVDARWTLLKLRRGNCRGQMRGQETYDRVEAKNLGYSI